MSCTNCFNGCTDIKSDQCVKYTGNDISSLGITNGDPLSTVISQLSTYLVAAMDGSGITPDVIDTCDLIAGYLEGTTLNDFISALIQAACDLQTQVDDVVADITVLNDDYDVDCLDGVVDSDNTHDVLQAVITKLCETEDTLTALSNTVSSSYVKLADLNSLIASYIASVSSSSLMATKMIPYAAIPFFAPDSYMTGKFDSSGAGIGSWANVYLCNGRNGTPDMRGRVPVCATAGMNGLTYNSAVDPAISGNPNYSRLDIQGANTVTLNNVNQIPSHTHIATPSVLDPTHFHYTFNGDVGTSNTSLTSTSYPNRSSTYGTDNKYWITGSSTVASLGKTSAKSTGITVSVSNSYVGGTASHNNIQPVIACYYIMYIP